ncbi:MAG TPA: DUF3313 family protein [Steroidobacteraceae bacterium]|nr:DUF3313 family protein [Steroidobacteraceae bacterium]
MKITRCLQVAAIAAAALLMANAWAGSKEDFDEAMSADGLQKIKVKGIDVAYALPGATLAGYNKVIIDPIDVAFHKDWDPERTGSRFKLSAEERENIRTGVSKIVHEEFVKELQKNNSYQIVTEAGPDVLRVEAMIINLYVNAPDTMTAGRSRTYTVSAGEMTLVIQLHDSESGAVIARAVDRREGSDSGMMELSNSVVNASEARSIASIWARILKKGLDNAHGIKN